MKDRPATVKKEDILERVSTYLSKGSRDPHTLPAIKTPPHQRQSQNGVVLKKEAVLTITAPKLDL